MTTEDKMLAFTQSRLSPQDRQAFELEMSNDPDLRAQVAVMTAVRDAFANDGDDKPSGIWNDLSDRIDAEAPHAANDNRRFGFSVLKVASIALAAIIGWQIVENTIFSQDGAAFQTASMADIGPSFQVFFTADAGLSDITLLLTEFNGRIVDGPSALGIYTVAFTDVSERDAAFSVLTERADIAEEVLKTSGSITP